MAQWEFVEWLLIWILETSSFQFEWDKGNLSKNAKKHGVQTYEVEEVFRSGMALPLGVQTSPASVEQRFGLVGPTLKGRILQIAFALRNDRVRVISARSANKKERLRYEETLRQITKKI